MSAADERPIERHIASILERQELFLEQIRDTLVKIEERSRPVVISTGAVSDTRDYGVTHTSDVDTARAMLEQARQKSAQARGVTP